jgi:hypothetical protein
MPGVIIFDPNDPSVGFSVGDDQAAGVYLDIETDTLYLTDLSNIIEWEGDTANMSYTWRSGRIRMPRKVNLGALLVDAVTYTDITVKLYAMIEDTLTLITSLTVTDSDPIRLPGGYTSNLYEVQVESTDRITSISVAQNIFDLAEG